MMMIMKIKIKTLDSTYSKMTTCYLLIETIELTPIESSLLMKLSKTIMKAYKYKEVKGR
jgi:hypothetical protein